MSYKLVSNRLGIMTAILSLWWMACGSSADSPVSLQVRFARLRHAVVNSTGLSADIQGLKIEFSRDGTLLLDTDCMAVDTSVRTSIRFDLTPGENTTITVSGYATTTCSGSPGWQGKAFGVAIKEGRQVNVPIYVTLRGKHLNPTRGGAPAPRAFSSASLLPDGRVLVAGGFTEATKENNVIKLTAACDAVLYDPGTATFTTSIPLAAGCRGLHRALLLSDGRILLVGGSGSATLDPTGIKRPILADAETLVSSAEVFDPTTDSFESVGVFSVLQRSDAAATVAGTRVVVLGGRTNLVRSDEIVRWVSDNAWEVDSMHLAAARSGAQAIALAQGIVVAGGNGTDAHTMELLNADTLEQRPLPEETDILKAVSGLTLTKVDINGALMVGGVFNDIASGVSDLAFGITWTDDVPVVTSIDLNHPRAYHVTEALPDGTLMVAGGFDGSFVATKDIEIIDTRNPATAPTVLTETLSIGPIGMASARLLDDSILLVGGLDRAADGGATLSGDALLFSP